VVALWLAATPAQADRREKYMSVSASPALLSVDDPV